MDDYSYAAEQIQDVLITDYLKTHPDMDREDVAVKSINGKVIIDSVINVFNELTKTRPAKLPDKLPFPIQSIDYLKLEGDVRYQQCQKSITSSKRLIDYLFTSQYSKFNITDKNTNLSYIMKNDRLCADAAVELFKVRKEFTRLMDEGIPLYGSIHTMVTFYLQSVREQLKSQAGLYKKEVDLGDKFTAHTNKILQSRSNARLSEFQTEFTKSLQQAHQMLEKIGVIKNIPQNGFTIKQFEEAIQQMEGNLQNRRDEIEVLQAVMAFIEETIVKLDEIANCFTDKNPQKSNELKPDESSLSNRMAVMTKMVKSKIFGRRM